MQTATQQAPTETTASQEASRAAAPASEKAQRNAGYSGNRAALRRLAAPPPPLQRKLTVGAANDPLEAEADRVADTVMRSPASHPTLSLSTPQISRKCGHCEDEEKTAQRKESGPAPQSAPPQVEQVLSAPGQPLDPATRAYMEPRFGHDFSQVRIHSGAQPARSASAIAANAYTVGRDIVFNQGRYAPQTAEGRHLLAHELTHVVQQGSATVARSVQRDLIFGNDYKNPYTGDDPESRSSEKGTWYPSTIDLAATATGSGGGTGAATFDELIATISSKGTGSITSLGIIGHATTDLISLSGTITTNPANVTFTGGGVIDSAGITSRLPAITAVRDRFATGAKIILYGCDAGIGNTLMSSLSSAFQVCVYGFSDQVWWCISWDQATRKINSRGRTWVDAAGLMAGGLLTPSCQGTFNADIGKLNPDRNDCSGVPTAPAPQKNTPKTQAPDAGAPQTATPQATPAVQTKLTVNTPGDVFEQEADRVADQVMRMADPAAARSAEPSQASRTLQRKCSCGGEGSECAACAEKREALQRSTAVTPANDSTTTAPASVHQVLNAPGQPLDSATRAFMEPRFGHDFSSVRVHTNQTAAESARSISAHAYTSAHHIVFNSSQYAPASSEGKRLLAHELAHVVQQQSAPSMVQRDDSPVDTAAIANDVEQLVRPGNDEKGAFDKLKPLDMAVLLKVVEQLYNDADATSTDEGKRRAYGLLNGDLTPAAGASATGPAATGAQVQGGATAAALGLSESDRVRLKAAFDAAPSRALRNPLGKDPGTNPTLSGYRDKSAATGPVRPGDWGEDPAHNTWVAQSDGVRTYFASGVDSARRTSTWLGNNPSNFDYTPSLTKRALGSFHWGTGVHHFAIYFSIGDAAADLRDRVKGFSTIGAYIKVHLGNNAKDKNGSADDYISAMQRAVQVTADDPAAKWTGDDAKWAKLIEGFKSAEGWVEGKTVTAANVKSLSADPKDAALITYYQNLVGATP